MNAKDRMDLNRKLKIYNCRNRHFSFLQELSPFRNSLFHGVPALVPNEHISMLRLEYKVPRKYDFSTYKENTYVPEFRLWFQDSQLKKYANVNKWYAKLRSIAPKISETTIKKFTNLTTTDIKIMYANMVRMHDADLLSIQYNGFNATSYRVKELSIINDPKLTTAWKTKLLHELRKHTAPTITSPGKDAFLFGYEREVWNQITKSLPSSTIKFVENAVHLDIYRDLISWSEDATNNELKMFDIFVPSPDPVLAHHFNSTGPINLNLNTIGQNFFGGQGISWLDRRDNEVFLRDIFLETSPNPDFIPKQYNV